MKKRNFLLKGSLKDLSIEVLSSFVRLDYNFGGNNKHTCSMPLIHDILNVWLFDGDFQIQCVEML